MGKLVKWYSFLLLINGWVERIFLKHKWIKEIVTMKSK